MHRKTWRRIGLFGILLAALGAGGYRMLHGLTLEIALLGDNAISLEYGEHYQEPGAKVCLEGMELKDVPLTVKGTVAEDRIGSNVLEYEASFLLWTARAERRIFVVDTESPVIELFAAPDQIPSSGEQFEEPGYRALDNYDGDITNRVIRREEKGRITYAVTDSSGNPATAEREVPYVDDVPPEIRLVGGETYQINVGQPYAEPGFSAWDDTDGDVTESVVVNGTVDILTPGVYPVHYCVVDACHNETEVVRNVEVCAVPRPDVAWPEEKTIYLTFDDGPGPHTMELLEVLERYGVRATFFVVDSEYRYLFNEILARGHSIGIHSASHNYAKIYESPEAYLDDLLTMQEIIYENTGVVTTLMRFPGGSSNLVSKRYCRGIMSQISEMVQNAGFQYFDWNVDSDDAGNTHKTKQVKDNVIRGIKERGICMVLQHDVYDYSVEAVEGIITWGLENGYSFQAVRNTTPGFHHDVQN